MEEKRFNVVFTGELEEGQTLDQVRKRLAAAFRTDEDRMARLFCEGGGVVRRNVDGETAEKYGAFIARAGARCRIEEVQGAGAEPPPLPPEAPPAEPKPEGPCVVSLKPMGAKLQYSPLRINRLTGWEGGLDLNRADVGEVAFEDVLALSVVKDAKSAGKEFLALFVRGAKRPFAVEATQIAFGDFPNVKGTGTELSLSNLIALILRRNPSIVRDADTEQFVQSGGYGIKEADLTVQATALAAALEQG